VRAAHSQTSIVGQAREVGIKSGVDYSLRADVVQIFKKVARTLRVTSAQNPPFTR